MQIYESEENGEVLEEDLATILEIMLGVKEVELSGLFLSLDGPDTAKITYGEIRRSFVIFELRYEMNSITFCTYETVVEMIGSIYERFAASSVLSPSHLISSGLH